MNRRSTVHGSFVARTSDLSVCQLIALLVHIMYQLVSNKHAVHPALSVSAAIYFHQAPPSFSMMEASPTLRSRSMCSNNLSVPYIRTSMVCRVKMYVCLQLRISK